jgi:hypothetical protein
MVWATRGECPVLSFYHAMLSQRHGADVESPGTVAVPGESSIVLALQCSCLSTCLAGIDYAACLHIL